MGVVSLSPLDLALSSVLVLLLALMSWRMGLALERRLTWAALRAAGQLLLVGLVLKALFDNANLVWIGLMSLVMLALAGREVLARQARRFSGWWGYALGTSSMFISSFSVTVLALLVVIGNDPWYQPQYAIPLLGMLLGNTMTGIALGIDRLTGGAWQQQAVLEARLALGQSAIEAIGDIRRDAVRVGTVQIINAMSAAGLITLPGMMTGQILAGIPPMEAVKYQILIMFLIAAGTGFGTITAVWLGSKRLFDERDRLRLERLTAVDGRQ